MKARLLVLAAIAATVVACRPSAETPVPTAPSADTGVEAQPPAADEGSEGSSGATAAQAAPAPSEGSATWTMVAADAVPVAVVARADAARSALAGRLLTTLTTTIAERGHAAAVDTCHAQAPGIAQAVAAEQGVAIGRTSFRIRNAQNTPPAWAAAWVDERIETARWASASDGRYGQLAPVRVSQPCLACHGPAEQIAPEVSAAIAAHYPGDAATGFNDGDLRGYIWVEVPAP